MCTSCGVKLYQLFYPATMFRNFAWSPSLTSVAITWVIISQSPRMRPLLTKFEFETKFEVKGITDLSSDYMMSTFLVKFALDLYIYTCTIQILYCHRAANGTRILTNFISINYIANQQWCAKFIFCSFPSLWHLFLNKSRTHIFALDMFHILHTNNPRHVIWRGIANRKCPIG